MKKAAAVIALLIAAIASGVAQHLPEPQLYSAGLPAYPPLARAARIQGKVKLEFVLNQAGEPASVTVKSGHPMLRGAAEANVKTWRFHLPNQFQPQWSYETTFTFRLSEADEYDNLDASGNAKLTVVFDSHRVVDVISKQPSSKYAQDCPRPEDVHPPTTISASDFVELSRSGCYGTCPVYKVRISGTGDVTWNGGSFVFDRGERHSNIGSEAAHALLRRFLAPEFWKLCGGYRTSITDSATTGIQVAIGGQAKTVSNYASSAPQWVERLEEAIDSSANTHQWRHGDPKTEPLTNIFQDSYYPKPGVTRLMKAAADADVAAMKAALKAGDEVDAVDSSGWTALMYAAASSHSEPVPFLLAAGANPNHKSQKGDTPLLATAVSGILDGRLLLAGADIDKQNSEGVTALMILAAKGDAHEIESALTVGADPSQRDAQGRTALDYLRLANCGRSPLGGFSNYESGGKCDHLNEDDVKKATKLLKTAKQVKPQ